MVTLKQQIINEVQRIEQNSNYSARGHFVSAGFWLHLHLWVGSAAAIAAAIAGVSALSQFNHLLAGTLAIIVAAVTGIMTFLNTNEKATSHRNAGNDYTSLRNKARIFRNVDCSAAERSEQELNNRLQELSEQRNALNKNNPQIPGWAYRRGKKGIEAGESDYAVDSDKRVGSARR